MNIDAVDHFGSGSGFQHYRSISTNTKFTKNYQTMPVRRTEYGESFNTDPWPVVIG